MIYSNLGPITNVKMEVLYKKKDFVEHAGTLGMKWGRRKDRRIYDREYNERRRKGRRRKGREGSVEAPSSSQREPRWDDDLNLRRLNSLSDGEISAILNRARLETSFSQLVSQRRQEAYRKNHPIRYNTIKLSKKIGEKAGNKIIEAVINTAVKTTIDAVFKKRRKE